ncbi:metal ABC transporter permease [Sphaerotilus mobilis]|nr:metal ABC transporter permease [Sphaerotilus mobilis]
MNTLTDPAGLHALLVQPFADYGFMRRALLATLALVLTAAPLGCLLVLRRMSLVGEAIAHALLPGAAVGHALAGLTLWAMAAGGLVAAALVATVAGLASRHTTQHEDAGFSAFYLIALAAGVLLMARGGGGPDLLHLLFGSVLAVDATALIALAALSSLMLLALAVGWRVLVYDSLDAAFLRGGPGAGAARWGHALLLALLVLHLVGALQALGALMAIGQLMLPALAARFWSRSLPGMVLGAWAIGALAGVGGLLLSFHAELPSGPAIVCLAGLAYVGSLLFGRVDGVWRWRMAAQSATVAVRP